MAMSALNAKIASGSKAPVDLAKLAKGGPPRWAEKLTTKGKLNAISRGWEPQSW